MNKHMQYDKAYWNFCKDNSPTGKPTSENTSNFQMLC